LKTITVLVLRNGVVFVKHRQHTLLAAVAAAVVLSLYGCGSSGNTAAASGAAPSAGRLTVVATTPEVADFVRNIAGDDVTLTQIIKPNVDPHEYEPTPADIQAGHAGDVGDGRTVLVEP
jgi:zinc/manganese transport system substrate-binding protein